MNGWALRSRGGKGLRKDSGAAELWAWEGVEAGKGPDLSIGGGIAPQTQVLSMKTTEGVHALHGRLEVCLELNMPSLWGWNRVSVPVLLASSLSHKRSHLFQPFTLAPGRPRTSVSKSSLCRMTALPDDSTPSPPPARAPARVTRRRGRFPAGRNLSSPPPPASDGETLP